MKENELVDPFCVEDQPQILTFEDVSSAAFKIKGGVINTPCVVLKNMLFHFLHKMNGFYRNNSINFFTGVAFVKVNRRGSIPEERFSTGNW